MVSLQIIKAAPIYRMRAIVQIISYTWRYINVDAWSISTPFQTRLWNLYDTVLTDVNCDLHINSQKPRLPYTSVVFAPLPPSHLFLRSPIPYYVCHSLLINLAELEIDFLIWKSIISNLLLFWCSLLLRCRQRRQSVASASYYHGT